MVMPFCVFIYVPLAGDALLRASAPASFAIAFKDPANEGGKGDKTGIKTSVRRKPDMWGVT